MPLNIEVNFDGLIGPTHNYAGLSEGNIASIKNSSSTSNPRAAALEGLEKMQILMELGIPQGVFPPQERPNITLLRQLGYRGNAASILQQAYRYDRQTFIACCSASSMWTANAATVSASNDCADGKVHFTPANLQQMFHRSIETVQTTSLLKKIFPDPARFVHHAPLPSHDLYGDEGAANHSRLVRQDGVGISLFTYGRNGESKEQIPQVYPARQSLQASQAIARQHQLHPDRTVYAQQSAPAIAAGVFHNDVIAVGHKHVFFAHEQAFQNQKRIIANIDSIFAEETFTYLEVPANQISLTDAVESYLFNSQLISVEDDFVLLLPFECEDNSAVRVFLSELLDQDQPIKRMIYVNLRQSMRNGGGPACLRLRVPLEGDELKAIAQTCLLDDDLLTRLQSWVKRHYRDRLQLDDLVDPMFLRECQTALDELSRILHLGSIYSFQKIR